MRPGSEQKADDSYYFVGFYRQPISPEEGKPEGAVPVQRA